MDIDGMLVLEAIIIDSIQAQYEQDTKQAEIDELERVQFVEEHETELLSMEVAFVPKDMDPTKTEALEVAML